MPLSVGGTPCSGLIRSRIWQAYQDGHKIINVSWTGTGLSVQEAEEITSNGTVLVLCAGNSDTSNGHIGISSVPGVIVVSSVNDEDKLGPTGHSRMPSVDLCAPGVDIVGATPDPAAFGYSKGSGTSNAAPLVSGTIALMLSINKCLTPADIENILKVTSDPIVDAGDFPTYQGAGRLNAYEAVKMAANFNSVTNINSNTTWTSDRFQVGEIVVKSGNTLTIKSKVTMMCESRIIVEKNAKLIIDGGHITSYHNDYKWNGIQVWGNKYKPPVQSEQGYVEIKNNSIIQNARVGITNFSRENLIGGGIIKMNNSKFLNCRRGVELNDYPHYSYRPENMVAGSSHCFFNNVDFIVDNMSTFKDGSDYPYLFSSWNVKDGIIITNCNFIVDLPYSDLPQQKRGFAIHLSSSGALVRDNSFENFIYGVNTSSYSGTPTRNVKIYRNTFSGMSESIMLAGDAYSDVRGNKISNMLQYVLAKPAAGIYVDHSRGANIVCNNEIDATTYSPNGGPGNVGIATWNTNAFPLTVKKNKITNAYSGFQSQLHSQNIDVVCNVFENNQAALRINPGSWAGAGHSFKDQGTGCHVSGYRAGNQFLNNYHDISSHEDVNIWNYFHIINPEETPQNIDGNTVSIHGCTALGGTDPNSQCSNLWDCTYADIILRFDLEEYTSRYKLLSEDKRKFSVEAQVLFGNIIRGYNDNDDIGGLQGFLENENDDISRRLLIPLYIEIEEYNKALSTINELSLPSVELDAYNNYYEILISLDQEDRRIDQLTSSELNKVYQLSDEGLEVSPMAKALLEIAYGEVWEHEIFVDNTVQTFSGYSTEGIIKETTLLDASPNPANSIVTFNIYIDEKEGEASAALVMKNLNGNEVYHKQLKPGYNTVTLNVENFASGIYFYSLIQSNKIIQTKKLSITK